MLLDMSKPTTVRIPGDMRDRIDEARGDVPAVRWVHRAIERYLGDMTGAAAPDGNRHVMPVDARIVPTEALPPLDPPKRAVDMSRQERLNKAKQKGKP